jgi:hypothetical protein
LNEAYLAAATLALGVDVTTERRAALHEAVHRAAERGREDLAAWLWTRLGDLAFRAAGIGPARAAYEAGRDADSAALGPCVGLAQVSVATRQASEWVAAVQAISERVDGEGDPTLVLRALALMDVDAVRGGAPDDESTWRATADELEAADEPGAAWHLWMAGASGLAYTATIERYEATCERALRLAVEHSLHREAIWACLELVQHLRVHERLAEADLRLSAAIELAEQVGDAQLLDLVLRLGSDLSAELGQVGILVHRLRLRADVAANRGQPALHVGLLHQAYLAAARGRSDEAPSLGEELVEALLGVGLDAVPGLNIEPLLDQLVALDSIGHARQLALSASQHAFASGRRSEAAVRLVCAARYALLSNDLDEAREMFDEAIKVSEAYGLGLHAGWLEERRELFQREA